MTQRKKELRKATRISMTVPIFVDVIGQAHVELHEKLAEVYQRVEVNTEAIGKKFPGVIMDLSTNGAFIAAEPLPLLSRVGVSFNLDGFGQVEALGWTLWRRERDCELPVGNQTVKLNAGFGILFESIPITARIAIHQLVAGRAVTLPD